MSAATPPHSALPRTGTARRGLLAVLMATLVAPLLVLSSGFVPATVAPAQAATLSRVQLRGLEVVHIAASKRGTPYRWGATGPHAFDCSGFTRWVYAHVGMRLPRTSSMQYHYTHRIASRDRRPGDLVFFHSGSGVYHVAIYAGNGAVWHAPHTGASVRREHLWTHAVSYGRVR